MTNILFIHQSAELYGSDKTLLLLLSKLDKSNFNAVVVLPVDGPLRLELESLNIKVVIAPVLKLYRKMFTPKNIINFIKQYKSSIEILDNLNRDYSFDIVYSNTLAVLIGMIFAKKRGIKHIWHVHEIIVHPKLIASIFPILLKKYADKIVCNSKATRLNLVKRIKTLNEKTIVIYNGVIQLKLNSNGINKVDFGFKENDIVITLVGRISRLKGHQWLLNTYVKYLQKYKNIKFVFVGSPVKDQEYYLEQIEKMIVDNNLEDKVKILPFTMNLSPIWQITNIAVVPSTEAESFGLVAVEAMLSSKPVIASNHGGLTEIVIDNETGFLIEPKNENELSKAIQTLIKNPELRKSFGEKGYQRAISEFSADKYVSEFEVLFSTI
jgi:glycosyltransferase involved in cell wall biosynthesis